jgi:hypothetical protein
VRAASAKADPAKIVRRATTSLIPVTAALLLVGSVAWGVGGGAHHAVGDTLEMDPIAWGLLAGLLPWAGLVLGVARGFVEREARATLSRSPSWWLWQGAPSVLLAVVHAAMRSCDVVFMLPVLLATAIASVASLWLGARATHAHDPAWAQPLQPLAMFGACAGLALTGTAAFVLAATNAQGDVPPSAIAHHAAVVRAVEVERGRGNARFSYAHVDAWGIGRTRWIALPGELASRVRPGTTLALDTARGRFGWTWLVSVRVAE